MAKYFVLIFLLFGFFLRFSLASFAPEKFIWDMETYREAAHEILSGRLYAECCNHNAGYGLFVAGVFSLFGRDNLWALRIVQIVIDLLNALLIYEIATSVFGRRIASVSYILYIFNPITASYAGMMMPEVVTIFLIALVAYIVSRKSFANNHWLWLSFGLSLGGLLLTRIAFYYFIFIIMGIIAIIKCKGIAKFFCIVVSLLGFFIISAYSLLSYNTTYGVWSLTPPYSLGSAGLYLNFYTDYRYPELIRDFPNFNPEYARMVEEYYATPLLKKKEFNKRYRALFNQKMKKDWPFFMGNIMRNAIWMWDKKSLYTYEDPFYPRDTFILRIFNIGVFAFFVVGMLKYSIKKLRKSMVQPIFVYSVLLFFYITFAFTIVSNETRHSLPFYPLLFLWAGYGIGKFIYGN